MFKRNSRNANNASNSKNASDSQDASNNSETSNNSNATQATLRMTAISRPLTTAGTQAAAGMKATTGPPTHAVWTPSKAGMLAKTVKPATEWREANSSRDNRNITAPTAEGRPATLEK